MVRTFRFWIARQIVRFGVWLCPEPERSWLQRIWDKSIEKTEEDHARVESQKHHNLSE